MNMLMNIKQAAEFLNLSPGTLYHLVSERRIPCVHLSRRCLRFLKPDLDRWIEEHKCSAASESITPIGNRRRA